MSASKSKPTARQHEYLSFIKAFTDRWGVPPSFEEIARHFRTSSPAVNGMIKTLETRSFLARVPGAPRTLRVLLSDEELRGSSPATATPATAAMTPEAAVQMASIVIERLVPALKGADDEHLDRALSAVAESLDIVLSMAGSSDDQRKAGWAALCRVASIAQGDSTETRPGRKLAWWRRPFPR